MSKYLYALPSVICATVLVVAMLGCGGTDPAPPKSYTVLDVNHATPPAIIYSTASEIGRIVSGTIVGVSGRPVCTYRLVRDRQANGVTSAVPDAVGTTDCQWNETEAGVATIRLEAPWGILDIGFRLQ